MISATQTLCAPRVLWSEPVDEEQRLLAEVGALEAELEALGTEAQQTCTERDRLEEEVSLLRPK